MATVERAIQEETAVTTTTSSCDESRPAVALSAAERARIERNRQRARALRDARLLQRPPDHAATAPVAAAPRAPLDSGGGFLLDEEEVLEVRPVAAPSAPLQPHEQPTCLQCDSRFPTSYLFDTFDYNVCDNCRDDEGAHELLTRTEAKTEFLLKDCDLDLRPPALRCVRRPNPHRGARSDMRLYLRAQVEERALLVWGSEERLEEQRAERGLRRVRTKQRQDARRLRALRMDVRSSLFARKVGSHAHCWGPETYDDEADTYTHACLECGHTESYEKM